MRILATLLILSVAPAFAKPVPPAKLRAQVLQTIRQQAPAKLTPAQRAAILKRALAAVRAEIRSGKSANLAGTIRREVRLVTLASGVISFTPDTAPTATPSLRLVALPTTSTLGDSGSATPTPVPATARPLTVGVIKQTVPAASTSQFVSIPIAPAPIYSAAVTQVSTDVSSSLANNQLQATGDSPFVAPSGPYFMRIASGQQQGRTMLVTAAQTSGNVTTFTADTTDNSNAVLAIPLVGLSTPFNVQDGDVIEIFPGYTLDTYFDGTVASGDSVQIYNNNSKAFDVYNYGGSGWTNASGLAAGDTALYPEASFLLTRGTSAPPAASALAFGSFPAVFPLTRIFAGYSSIYTSSRYPIGLTLGSIGTYGLTISASPYTADTLSIFGSGTWTTYYCASAVPTWQVPNSATSQNSTPLNVGSGFSVYRRSGVPAPASLGIGSYLFYNASTLPYSYP